MRSSPRYQKAPHRLRRVRDCGPSCWRGRELKCHTELKPTSSLHMHAPNPNAADNCRSYPTVHQALAQAFVNRSPIRKGEANTARAHPSINSPRLCRLPGIGWTRTKISMEHLARRPFELRVEQYECGGRPNSPVSTMTAPVSSSDQSGRNRSALGGGERTAALPDEENRACAPENPGQRPQTRSRRRGKDRDQRRRAHRRGATSIRK